MNTDPVVEQIVDKLLQRSEVGLKKYGVGLDRSDLSLIDWLQHLQEELLDGAGYCQSALNKLKDIKEEAQYHMTDFEQDFYQEFDKIVEWNAIANNGQHDFSDNNIELYNDLLTEEEEEFMEAFEGGDKEETLKELCDIIFVGAYYLFLIDPNRFNKEQVSPVYTSPGGLYGFLNDGYAGYSYDSVSRRLSIALGALVLFDGNGKKALNAVISSNYSKFITYREEDEEKYDAECIRIEEVGRYKGVIWEKVGDYVILFDEKGKIMKPSSYISADLSGCFE